ncbi:2-hydroxychromene-2-carboxylate isomerase [Hyphococcus sp.]|uniref:2-hydroxychromene-2-carboxylate isomerase n=1 Tax=Hyphococcus sp. TaxID=2038636 RepID=UPI003D0B211F
MTQTPSIRVYHSFRSPYSRLGLHILAREGIKAALIPFTGPPEGVSFNDPVANPLKLSYYLQDAPRMTMRMGLPIQPPQPFDVDLAPSYKAAVAAERDGKGLDYAIAVSDARWGKGRDVSDLSVLEACAEKIGWDKAAVASAQEDDDVSAEMRRHRKLIAEDGVFGVPFAVMGAKKYWGHDRFDLLVEDAGV